MTATLSAVLGLEVSPFRTKTETEDVCHLAARCLRQSPYRGLHSLSCEFCDGILILRGNVDSYYLKQIAQTVVAKLPFVNAVDNRVEVVSR